MLLAKIREIDCIGCGKCLDACPVDAILGAPKFMHTVLEQECIGCKLCVSPCPMDCIEIREVTTAMATATATATASANQTDLQQDLQQLEIKKIKGERAKKRFQARRKRLLSKEALKLPDFSEQNSPEYKLKIKQEIETAITQVKLRRQNQKGNQCI